MNSGSLFAALSFTLAALIPIGASAACKVCWLGPDYCTTFPENSCNEYHGSSPCFTLGAQMFRPSSDHILTDKGRAWLVQGPKKTPFASDGMTASFKRLNTQYAASKSTDPRIKKESETAYSALFGGPDNGTVSPGVLLYFSKEMGLSVRPAEDRLKK